MTKHWISYLLIALIACQSVIAMADIHQPHQSGIEHLEFEHEHDQINETQSSLTADELNKIASTIGSAYDCHHCCHCHGTAQLFLSVINYSVNFTGTFYKFSEYRLTFISYQLSPDLRPPIV